MQHDAPSPGGGTPPSPAPVTGPSPFQAPPPPAASAVDPGIAPPPPTTTPHPRPLTSDAEWPAKVADTIDDVVSALHDRVVRPLVIVARGLVFGLLIATMTLVISVLLSVALIRLLTVYAFGHRVWASDALVGGVLATAGLIAWSRRQPRGEDA